MQGSRGWGGGPHATCGELCSLSDCEGGTHRLMPLFNFVGLKSPLLFQTEANLVHIHFLSNDGLWRNCHPAA